MAATVAGRAVHLVGSVPMSSRREVMRAVGRALGSHIRYVSDGEVGRPWVIGLKPRFEAHPAFEPVPDSAHAYHGHSKLRIRSGIDRSGIAFDDLGYVGPLIESFGTFREEQEAGNVAPDSRFLMAFPTPIAPVAAFVVTEDQLAVEAAYTSRLLSEFERIFAALPHDRVALQWDVAREFMFVEGVMESPWGDPVAGTVERLGRLARAVPVDVPMGIHLCYGNFQHRHFIEPKDLGNCVAMANAIAAGIGRTIAYVHMPVPRDRADDAYFAPLKNLRLHAESELILGLVHHTDGVEGTRRRMAAADRVVRGYGIATECGWGPRDPATIPELLHIHAELARAG